MNMGLRELAEGIILQSIEDLSDRNLREGCIAFFKGNDFTICAELAAMDVADQVKLLTMVKCSVELEAKNSCASPTGFKKYKAKLRERQSASAPSL